MQADCAPSSGDLELLFDEIGEFKRCPKRGPSPYERTLHKLWNKVRRWRADLARGLISVVVHHGLLRAS